METGRPVENPEMDYLDEAKWILPGPLGGHNWQAMSYDAATRTMYLPAQEWAGLYKMSDEFVESGFYKHEPAGANLGTELGRVGQNVLALENEAPTPNGYLKAIDPLTGEEKWAHVHEHYWNGGVLATQGGLVFQGDAMGHFSAYDAETGEVLWQAQTFTSILGPPISFAIDGTQYVAVMTGTGGGNHFDGYFNDHATIRYGNHGRMLVFTLDGTAELPRPTVLDRQIPERTPAPVSTEDLDRGDVLYHSWCAPCHGINVASGGVYPDLRLMNDGVVDTFEQIVIDGTRASLGMASFADVLTAEDAELVLAYVLHRAEVSREAALESEVEEAPEE